MSGCFYFVRYRAMYILQLFVNQAVPSIALKLTLSFIIKPFLLHNQTVQIKIQISSERKAFLIIFEGLSLKQIKQKPFLEGDSPALKSFIAIILIFWRVADFPL